MPVAAGLGGGSSDAATALRLAAAAWAIPLKEERCLRLAAGLGSDVPFFVIGGWALVGGRGERLTRLPPPRGGDAGILLVTPDVRLATRDVFAAYDRLAAPQVAHGGYSRPAGSASPARLLAARLRSGVDAIALARLDPANDLWPAAASLVPGLAALRDGLAALAGRPVHLSGSGPTLFAVYPSGEGAELGARRVEAAVRSGALPVPGRGRPTIIATRTLGADTPGG
jgi:4-diphosphocytidyl-2-C-methyl-D-erythritol kinase